MSSLKKKLAWMFSSEIEKLTTKLLDPQTADFLDEDKFERYSQILEGKDKKIKKVTAMQHLLKQVDQKGNWIKSLKGLMLLHKFIHSVGEDFCLMLSAQKPLTAANFEFKNDSRQSIIESVMMPHYFIYLQRLSYNYEDYMVCFSPDHRFYDKMSQDNLTMLHYISKVQNMLNYLLTLAPLFDSAFQEFPDTGLVKQFCYFCMTDSSFYYNFMNDIISHMLKGIFNLPKEDSIFLYEIYIEHTRITNKMRLFYNTKRNISEFDVKNPNFFVANPSLTKQIETHIKKVKQAMKPVKQFIKKPRKKMLSIHTGAENEPKSVTEQNPDTSLIDMSQVIHESKTDREPVSDDKMEILKLADINKQEEKKQNNHSGPTNGSYGKNTQTSNAKERIKTIDDISKSIIQITTPNFKEIQKKELFKAPSSNFANENQVNGAGSPQKELKTQIPLKKIKSADQAQIEGNGLDHSFN